MVGLWNMAAALRGGAVGSGLLLCACSSIPPFVLNGDNGQAAPAGPKVATLMGNIKCELWRAAHSAQELPFYTNDPIPRQRNAINPGADRILNIKNMLQQIEYVGEATLTLDVTDAGAFNPSIGISEYNSVPVGFFPATGFLMSVAGTYSDTAHRFITLDSSIDFGRLIDSPPDPRWDGKAVVTKLAAPPAIPDTSACDSAGSDLTGDLRLQEVLATGFIQEAQNDIALFPHGSSAVTPPTPAATISGTFSEGLKGKFTGTLTTPAPAASPAGAASGYGGGNVSIFGLTPAIPIPTTFPFGQINAQIDFTVVENVNGGPTWTTRYFKGPGGNSSGLLNFNRQIKDTLVVTFIPV